MTEESRRLAAIMFADMAGYTSLSQRDEVLALKLVEESRKIIRPLLGRHGGREVKTMGDGLLVEFSSALEAVRCAFAIQQSLYDYNGGRSVESRLSLRIGIHVGDVVHAEGDVMGDAVNVASRIEPLAKPGGICLSRQAYDQVRNRFEFPLLSLGTRQLKGISQPLDIYGVSLPWERGGDAESGVLDAKRLAVLPLANYSEDPNDEYFADGMTEELISTISRIRGLRVIARTSAMQYKGQKKRISEIGNELRAGTLIEGSVRKSAGTVRISVQLIDAASEEHLWAEDYERKLENVFQIQRDIAAKVAKGLKVKLLPEEKKVIERTDTGNPDAFTLYLKGRYYWGERSQEGLQKAADYFQRAIDTDPSYARAYCGLADTYSIMAFHGFMPAREAEAKARSLAKRAIEIDETLAEAFTSLAFIGDDSFDWEEGEELYNKALALNPSYATAHFWYGLELLWRGRVEEALEHSRQAEELDPLSPAISLAYGQALTYSRRYDEAIRHLEEKVEADPEIAPLHYMLGIAYLYRGLYEKAEEQERIGIDRSGGGVRPKAVLAIALAKQGKMTEAHAILSEMTSTGAPSALLGMVNLELGDKEKGMAYVEKAFREKESGLAWLSVIPSFDALRPDPRFISILRAMRLYRG